MMFALRGGTTCLVMGLVFKTSESRRESRLVGSIPMYLRHSLSFRS